MRTYFALKVYVVAVVLSSVIHTSFNAVLNPETKRLYDDLKSGRGLYSEDDKITVLNATNFKTTIFGSKNAWLIEFYNSWCGFCHRFAPVMRSLAADTYAWRDVVSVAAVDCSTDDNNPVCREYEVMYYPMLKFFPADSKSGVLGSEMEKGNTIESIRASLVETLRKEQVAGRGAGWPNITPYRSSDTANLWKNAPEYVKYIILIFEQTASSVGLEVILDLHTVKSIQIRHVTSENEGLGKLMGVSLFPSIVVLERNSNVIPLKVSDDTRTAFRQTIKTFLEVHNIAVPEEQTVVDPGDWRHIKAPDLSELIRAAEEEKKLQKIKDLGDAVFQADLEKAVKYSLEHEVSARKLISGAALRALQKYITVLAKYFPVKSQSGKNFFSDLRDKLNEVPDIEGEAFLHTIKSAENEHRSPFVIASVQDWVGCKGSAEHLRGFPCGMWMLFHTLTVNSVLEKSSSAGFNSLEVLDAMLGYVTHFFGCQDCSRHFQQMASSMKSEVSSPNDSVMWLWRSHNKVNKRLAGDASEDPLHLKIQFPSQKTCTTCRGSDSAWNEPQVLQHLFGMYGRENISLLGLSEKLTADADDHKKKNSKVVADTHGGMDQTEGDCYQATSSTTLIFVCLTAQTLYVFLK